MSEHGEKPPLIEVDDPRTLIADYLGSTDFATEFGRFMKISPLPRSEAQRFGGDQQMLNVYNMRRYLNSEFAELDLGNYIQSHNIRFIYNFKMFSNEERVAIDTYYDQWNKVTNTSLKEERETEQALIYDKMQRQYHCDAAEAITRRLTQDGIIPGMHQFFDDADPVGMREGIGREIVRRIRNYKKAQNR